MNLLAGTSPGRRGEVRHARRRRTYSPRPNMRALERRVLGRRFGPFIVVERARKRGKSAFRIRCDCGRTVVREADLFAPRVLATRRVAGCCRACPYVMRKCHAALRESRTNLGERMARVGGTRA